MQSGSTTPKTDRRAHPRQKIQSLTYVELGHGNGGIALNISEGGMTVVAAQPLDAEGPIDIALQLPQTRKRLGLKGEIRWMSDSRKEAGVQFIDLTPEALADIRDWMTREATPEPVSETISTAPLAREMSSLDDGSSFFADEAKDPEKQEAELATEASASESRDLHTAAQKLERVFEEGHPAPKSVPADTEENEKQKEAPAEEIVLEPLAKSLPIETIPPLPAAREAQAPLPAASADSPVTRPVRNANGTSRRRPFSILAAEMAPEKAPEPPPTSPIEELLKPEPETAPFSPVTDLESPRPVASNSPHPLELPRPMFGAGYGAEEIPATSEKDIHVHLQSNWVLALLILLLAVISFASGMAVRRGALNRIVDESENYVGARPSPAVTPGASTIAPNSEAIRPANAATQKQVDIQVVDSTNRTWTIPMAAGGALTTPASASAVTADSATTPSTAPPAQQSSAVSAPSTTPAVPPANPALNTKTTSNTDLSEATTTDNGSGGLMLTLPETPVAASSLVAISARRFIPIPPEAAARNRNLQVGSLENLVEPTYPAEAMQHGVEGTVKLRGTISLDGSMQFLDAVSGPQALMPATLIAVRNWRYNPTLLNGKPIETQEEITIVFRLPR